MFYRKARHVRLLGSLDRVSVSRCVPLAGSKGLTARRALSRHQYGAGDSVESEAFGTTTLLIQLSLP